MHLEGKERQEVDGSSDVDSATGVVLGGRAALRALGCAALAVVALVLTMAFVAPSPASAADGDFRAAIGAECKMNRVPGNTVKMRCNYGGSDINRIDLFNNSGYAGTLGLIATCSADSGGMTCQTTSSYSSQPRAISQENTWQETGLFDMVTMTLGSCEAHAGRSVSTSQGCAYPQPTVGWRSFYCGSACNVDAYPAPYSTLVCVDDSDCAAGTTTTTTTTTTSTTTTTRPPGGLPGHVCEAGLVLSMTEVIGVLIQTAAQMNIDPLRDEDVAWMIAIGIGESGLRVDAVGDGGDSLGIWQVNMPAHPSYDPVRLANDPYYQAFAALTIAGIASTYGVADNAAVYHPWTVYWSRDGGVTNAGDGNGIAADYYAVALGYVQSSSGGSDPGCGGGTGEGNESCGSWTHLVCHIKKAVREVMVFLFVPSDSAVDDVRAKAVAVGHKAPLSFMTEVVGAGTTFISGIPAQVALHRDDCIEFAPAGISDEATEAVDVCLQETGAIPVQARNAMGVFVYLSFAISLGVATLRRVNAG